jgi:hypothetical protein
MVWTLVCSGRSGDSGHPWGVQILDAWGTLDGKSALDAWGTLDGSSALDACAILVRRERQESGRLVIVGSVEAPWNTSCDWFAVRRLLLNQIS